MAQLFDIADYDDEERRFLKEMAAGLEVSIERAAGTILAEVTANYNAASQRCVVAKVTDMALARAKKRTEKGPLR